MREWGCDREITNVPSIRLQTFEGGIWAAGANPGMRKDS
jgi:hypothetical protein